MKKAWSLILVIALTAGMLCGCGSLVDMFSGSSRYEALAGTWSCVVDDSESEARALLDFIEAYEDEIAAADLTSLKFVKTVTFNADKTYRFGYDIEGTKACVRDFYDRFFNGLYDVRGTLNDDYGMDFDSMSKEEFLAFYAELYGYAYYEDLLDALSEEVYDYASLAANGIETGTFTINRNQILCTITGETEAESMDYSIKGNTLTLGYMDGTEVYTKVN